MKTLFTIISIFFLALNSYAQYDLPKNAKPGKCYVQCWNEDKKAFDGWIEVLCRRDLTIENIALIQRNLKFIGFYDGFITGEIDTATATAIVAFQEINDYDFALGQISWQTWEAIKTITPRREAQLETKEIEKAKAIRNRRKN